MKIKLFNNGITPVRKHKEDAGLDIFMPEAFTIKPGETLCLPLGFGVQIPHGYVGQLVSRSSIAKKGLNVYGPYIDEGYTGEVHLLIHNDSQETYTFERGDRVCSLGVYMISMDKDIEIVDEFPKTERGEGGLGSTGK